MTTDPAPPGAIVRDPRALPHEGVQHDGPVEVDDRHPGQGVLAAARADPDHLAVHGEVVTRAVASERGIAQECMR